MFRDCDFRVYQMCGMLLDPCQFVFHVMDQYEILPWFNGDEKRMSDEEKTPSVTSFYHFIQSLERRLEPKLLRLLLELPLLRREECVVCERFNIDATCPYTYGSM